MKARQRCKRGRASFVAAALLLAVATAVSGADAPLTSDAAAALLRKSPAFGPKSGWTFTRVSGLIPIPEPESPNGWIVEAEWREKGRPVTGRALIVPAGGTGGDPVFFAADG
jgi:hypothetical protein